jgi:hypothetical protein
MVKPGVPPNAGLFLSLRGETSVAKPIRKKDLKRKTTRTDQLPLTADNFKIIGGGLVLIVAGYLAMIEGSVEGFLPLVLAPILLVLGYCVVIPIGILYRKRKSANTEGMPGQVPTQS